MEQASVCQGDDCDQHPQPCIDMCDAIAYCEAVGRSLCTKEEWNSACTANGLYEALYGEAFVGGTCNDYTAVGDTTVPVASLSGCQSPADSGFAGVFDLIGNVEEWVDDCSSSAGTHDVCRPHGLPFGYGAAAPICNQATYAERSQTRDTLGFRCCTPSD